IAVRLRIFINNAGARMRLASEMLEFAHPCVLEVIWIVHDGHRLMPFRVQCPVLKAQRPIGKRAKPKIKKFVDRPCIHNLLHLDFVTQLAVINAKGQFDVIVIEHVFEHARETLLGHRLEAIREVPVVTVATNRNTGSHLCIQFRRIKPPLLARVISKEFFIKIAPHAAEHDLFGVPRRWTRNRPSSQETFHLGLCQSQFVQFVNLDTINKLYELRLTETEVESFLAARAIPCPSPRHSEQVVLSRVGRDLYEKFFRNYTRKQWGLDPSELDAQVAARIPVRSNRDDRYFTDRFQSMPKQGFTRMFENMLDHDNIELALGVDYRELRNEVNVQQIVYTGPVDEFFDFRFGPLPYRSLRFEHRTLDTEWHQPVAVVNYPNDFDYTRVSEFKHLTGQTHSRTSIVYEYPQANGDPYYPIPQPANAAVYAKYRALAEQRPDVHFVGRLATYRYYNMDQVIGQALTLARKLIQRERLSWSTKKSCFQSEPVFSRSDC